MTVPNVVSGTDIESAWGNAVAGSINQLENDVVEIDATLINHQAAIEDLQDDFDEHVDDSEDPHAAAGYMKNLIYDPNGVSDDAFNFANFNGNIDCGTF